MSRNIKLSQGYKGYNENNRGKTGILLAKGKWDKNLLVVFFWQRVKTYEFTHFFLYDYWAAELA